MWLPLAMAELTGWIKNLVRMFGNAETRREVKVGTTSEKLREWCLPLLASALEKDEERFRRQERKRRKDAMGDTLADLAKRFGAKVERN